MPLALEPLADSADLSTRLGVADDAKAQWCVSQISAAFRGATGAQITKATDTLVLDGYGSRELLVPVAPIISIASVIEQSVALVLGTDYEVSKRNGILRRLVQLWPDSYEAIEVTCTYGYELIPDEISAAVLDEAAILYNVTPGISAETIGTESTAFAVARSTGTLGMSDTWAALVQLYKVDRGRV